MVHSRSSPSICDPLSAIAYRLTPESSAHLRIDHYASRTMTPKRSTFPPRFLFLILRSALNTELAGTSNALANSGRTFPRGATGRCRRDAHQWFEGDRA